jgi:hypothetical protein
MQLTVGSQLIFKAEAEAILALEKFFLLSTQPESSLYFFLAQPEAKEMAKQFSGISKNMQRYLSTDDEIVDGEVLKNQYAAYLNALSNIRSTRGHSMSQYLAVENPRLGKYFQRVLPRLKVINEAFRYYMRFDHFPENVNSNCFSAAVLSNFNSEGRKRSLSR